MNEAVKTRPGRRERNALATRRRMLDAAETLFTRDGYAATTMTAIAEAADVAVQTVYAVFGTKRAILTQLLGARIVGDDQQTPLRDRAEWQAMEREADPRLQLALLAGISTRIGSRIAALLEVMAAAAGSDPDIAAAYRQQQQARYDDQCRLARSLRRKGALRAGLSETAAADIIWTLANARTHSMLIGARGWAADEYERWLGQLLASALLADIGELP
jgi:TetR/AcrR family transcriptional regulator, regulator of autoinduction and epiphytic fitness